MQANEYNDRLDSLLRFSEQIVRIEDLDALLDQLLLEARRYTGADAGSIYLAEDEKLRFAYVQNDRLQSLGSRNNRFLYNDVTIPIDESSIAGFAASRGEMVNINDVYNLPDNAPYSFNTSFDEQTGYKTVTTVAAPLTTGNGTLVGVLQLINKDEQKPFSEEDLLYLRHFGLIASGAIDRARITRTVFTRMLQMAELRDPKETGAHVNRVGTYSIEIYEAWARKRGVPDDEMRAFKGSFRIAAMLHDVGKVAISDKILKKPAKLTDDEFKVMQNHTEYGASLFGDTHSLLDEMSRDVVLGHHERWDGNGYPKGLKGEEIPLTARIVAMADVYDALISSRVYKSAWSEEDVDNLLREEAGKHFDPELVEIFFTIQDVIRAIRLKYMEQD
ncbi:MAG: HD domain-containing protein [Gammaproteobacteria bacterium]|jgi:HD-GYP domain-containing protein (c-di-GMP phosphodiesterase class II)|nr:HD domain-containing protein [Gammaproteobacteria bacterium]MBT3489870.1 HD domain-containing protein [Gammaproteobacteria bacterium]MBT3844918.1 HD domain-containing protein [Gammaproteobacteria bacterium]MBT3894374.1 HD domain-containing protein [Gammaproteobacteria bacterium]MBT4299885.1 HD domain-containing protein [Gammaproteobacteria bacterium]